MSAKPHMSRPLRLPLLGGAPRRESGPVKIVSFYPTPSRLNFKFEKQQTFLSMMVVQAQALSGILDGKVPEIKWCVLE
jgi:hypothetical protein